MKVFLILKYFKYLTFFMIRFLLNDLLVNSLKIIENLMQYFSKIIIVLQSNALSLHKI